MPMFINRRRLPTPRREAADERFTSALQPGVLSSRGSISSLRQAALFANSEDFPVTETLSIKSVRRLFRLFRYRALRAADLFQGTTPRCDASDNGGLLRTTTDPRHAHVSQIDVQA